MMSSTSVLPSDLNYHHYSAARYESDVQRAIPGYNELHVEAELIVRSRRLERGARVLDLGVGTGVTSALVLRCFPTAHIVGVDFSERMLAGARERLAGSDVELICADYSALDLPRVDAAVSVFSIHHQETLADKQNLFGKIYDALPDDGFFLFGDLFTHRNLVDTAHNDALHYHHLVEHAASEEALREWAHHHMFLNRRSPLEDQVDALKEVGFCTVDVVYQKINTALVYAVK